MTITKGKKIQRKGSSVVWRINSTNEFAAGSGYKGLRRVLDEPTEVQIYCTPKNRAAKMYKWISIENLNKNWVEA